MKLRALAPDREARIAVQQFLNELVEDYEMSIGALSPELVSLARDDLRRPALTKLIYDSRSSTSDRFKVYLACLEIMESAEFDDLIEGGRR